MKKDAIGLIETRGLVAAVEAVDACLKAANVEFTSFKYTTGGLVCIIVNGDVGAVRAAVDAGSVAAAKLGDVVGVHVIPRPAGDTTSVIDKINRIPKDAGKDEPSLEEQDNKSSVTDEKADTLIETPEETKDESVENLPEEENSAVKDTTEADTTENGAAENDEDKEDETAPYDEEELIAAVVKLRDSIHGKEESALLEENKALDKYSVRILRRITRVLPLEDLDKSDIYTMRKKELLDFLMDFTAKEGGNSADDEA